MRLSPGFWQLLINLFLLSLSRAEIESTSENRSPSTSASTGASCPYQTVDGICYGSELRSKHFYLQAENFTNLNHGSFGTVPRPVHEAQEDFFLQQERLPDIWFRQQYYEALDESRGAMAEYIGAKSGDVVLVENASSAVNAVLRSMKFQRGDKVLRLSTAYGMVVNTLNYLAESSGVQVVVAEVKYPVSGEQILDAVTNALTTHPDMKLKLCVFSHISSLPAIVEPLQELVAAVRAHAPDSSILVDGAHAPGQIELNVPDYNVDFYLGNCHKWLYAPKGTAFLWLDSKHQKTNFPEPTVISSKNALGLDYIGRFSYTGTRDYTSFAALPAALDFRAYLGGEKNIRTYCHNLAIDAGRYLATAWKTALLVPPEMSGFMVNVMLPSGNATHVKLLQERLYASYGIYIVYGAVALSDKNCAGSANHICVSQTVYVTRLSAQVYLDMDDFKPLGKLVPKVLAKISRDSERRGVISGPLLG